MCPTSNLLFFQHRILLQRCYCNGLLITKKNTVSISAFTINNKRIWEILCIKIEHKSTHRSALMIISEFPDIRVLQSTLGKAWRLHMHCYQLKDNMQSFWLHYHGTAGMHLLWQHHPSNSAWLLFILILIVCVQSGESISCCDKMKMM